MRLRFDGASEELERVLTIVSMRLADMPHLAEPLARCPGFALEIEATDTYGPPRMQRDAARVRIAAGADGEVYSLSELNAAGTCSGGWMGSCIPGGTLRRFLMAWLEQTDPYLNHQIALF